MNGCHLVPTSNGHGTRANNLTMHGRNITYDKSQELTHIERMYIVICAQVYSPLVNGCIGRWHGTVGNVLAERAGLSIFTNNSNKTPIDVSYWFL